MHILFLTQILPFPPDAGPRVKTWQVIRYLVSQGHRVTLVSFVRPEELPYCDEVRRQVSAFHGVPIRRSRVADGFAWLRSHLTGRPFLVERDDQRAMRDLLAQLFASETFDALHADQLTMTQFASPLLKAERPDGGQPKRPLLLFDAHNATWKILERMAEGETGIKRALIRQEARRILRYEASIMRQFDTTLAVSAIDRLALLEAAQTSGLPVGEVEGKVRVVPIAVDTGSLQPVARERGSLQILTLGTLHYPPNADGIRWFAREVFPRVLEAVPGATLTIAGKNPPADFLAMQSADPGRIRVTGYVPDLNPWLQRSAVLVVPVRVGGGMRVRILEAFARAIPMVTTTIGLEGIDAEHSEHLLVADSAQSFADATIQLLCSEELQSRLANNGRRLAEEKYDWRAVLSTFEHIYPSGEGVPIG